jgi:hypothetical protein
MLYDNVAAHFFTSADINRVKATQVNGADTAITGANGDVDIDHQ